MFSVYRWSPPARRVAYTAVAVYAYDERYNNRGIIWIRKTNKGRFPGSPRGSNRGDPVAAVVATAADASTRSGPVFIIIYVISLLLLLLCSVASPAEDPSTRSRRTGEKYCNI